jgi:hypothetical protein
MMAAAFFDGTTRPGRFRLAIVDVGLRRMQAIDGVVGDGAPQSIAWSPDGARVFVSSDADHSLATWRLGESRLSQLRLAGVRARQLVVLPAAM